MDEKRKSGIALAFLSRGGIRLNPNLKRDLGDIAKETGIPQDELKECVKLFIKDHLVKELLEEALGRW